MDIQTEIRNYGISNLAKACDVSPQAVHKWLENGVPAERVLEVEKLTGISRHELRPDVFGDPPGKFGAAGEISGCGEESKATV